jgi:transcriptional regulator GlxA family with amidase domain
VVTSLTPRRIGLIGFDDVTALHLIGPSDIFAAAALDDGFGGRIGCYEVTLLGLTSTPFRAESGIVFKPHKTLRSAPPLDTIIIPGGSGLRRAEICGPIADWVRRRAKDTRRIASICSGIYALAPTGLLDGREVTTHWRFASDVARRFPSLRVNCKRHLIADEPIYTAAGLTSGVDLSLKLVEEDYGSYVTSSLERDFATYLAQPRPRTTETSDSFYFSNQTKERFAGLVSWMLQNLDQDLSVEILARRACMALGTFNCAFKSVFGNSPAAFVENLRLNEARRRLSTSRKTLRCVAESVGFKSADAFRRAFEQRFGERPIAAAAAYDIAVSAKNALARQRLRSEVQKRHQISSGPGDNDGSPFHEKTLTLNS